LRPDVRRVRDRCKRVARDQALASRGSGAGA